MNTPPKHLAAAIALLDYPDTEGIHHSERHWREVARWLLRELRKSEPSANRHHWVFNHPESVRSNVWYCPFCRTWTANPAEYFSEPCEGRT